MRALGSRVAPMIASGYSYRWNGEGNGAPRAWYIDVDDAAREAEIAFLKSDIYRGEIDLLVRQFDAYDRFSDRC